MAIINSVAVGRGRKSVGEFTYRLVRGRTVAARRVLTNASKSLRQVTQRSAFKVVSQFVSIFAPIIDAAYVKSRYGSARNYFMKENFRNLRDYVQDPLVADLLAERNTYGLALELPGVVADDAASLAPDLYKGDTGVRLMSYAVDEGSLGGTNSFGLMLNHGGKELVALARSLNADYADMADAKVLNNAVTLDVYYADAENYGLLYFGSFKGDELASTDITEGGAQWLPGFEVIAHIPAANFPSVYDDEKWGVLQDEGLVPNWLSASPGVPIVIPKFCGKPISTSVGLAIGRGVNSESATYPKQSLWPQKIS